MMHIVLVEPEIPQNTGNIARTCAATGASLHLIEPLGFTISDRYLKRAGLDYWSMAQVFVHPNFAAFAHANAGLPLFFFTTKGASDYTSFAYPANAALVFGKETQGLPEMLLQKYPGLCARIPMRSGARSLNLSNSVAVALYEALRQHDFDGLLREGQLTGREEETPPWLDYL